MKLNAWTTTLFVVFVCTAVGVGAWEVLTNTENWKDALFYWFMVVGGFALWYVYSNRGGE